MQTPTPIQKKLKDGLHEISSRDFQADENLLAGAIDSLAWVELINLVEALAQEKSMSVDLESLLTRQKLTLNMILEILNEEHLS